MSRISPRASPGRPGTPDPNWSAEIRKRAVARHAQATASSNHVDFYREILAVRTTGTER